MKLTLKQKKMYRDWHEEQWFIDLLNKSMHHVWETEWNGHFDYPYDLKINDVLIDELTDYGMQLLKGAK